MRATAVSLGALLLTTGCLGQHTTTTPTFASKWISFSQGHLTYGQDAQGNRIPDFSYAGYEGGGIPLPKVPAKVTLSPSGTDDDTGQIQAAIDGVSALPLDSRGFRGAVVLSPGAYRLAGTLHIKASGVVLRGGSDNPAATQLMPTGTKARTLIDISGSGSIAATGPAHMVTDDYVPVGARQLTVDSTADFAVGDRVIVQRPQTQAWIDAIGMNQIPPRPDGKPIKQWTPDGGLQFERQITAIRGNRITFDVPLTNALERPYTNATVWRYSFAGRISQVGLENVSSDGQQEDGSDFFNIVFVNLDSVENAWVQNTVVTRYTQPYQVGPGGLRITILHTQSLQMDQKMPQSILDQPFTYGVSGQMVLVRDAVVTGSDVHAWTTQSRTPGPNVFSQFDETNSGSAKFDSGPHQRWATGILAEDMVMRSTPVSQEQAQDYSPWPATELEDRQWFGSGQGWAAGNSVLWNVRSTTWRVEEPPTAHNWAIGVTGTMLPPRSQGSPLGYSAFDGPGEYAALDQTVHPSSLYDEQLAERLGRSS